MLVGPAVRLGDRVILEREPAAGAARPDTRREIVELLTAHLVAGAGRVAAEIAPRQQRAQIGALVEPRFRRVVERVVGHRDQMRQDMGAAAGVVLQLEEAAACALEEQVVFEEARIDRLLQVFPPAGGGARLGWQTVSETGTVLAWTFPPNRHANGTCGHPTAPCSVPHLKPRAECWTNFPRKPQGMVGSSTGVDKFCLSFRVLAGEEHFFRVGRDGRFNMRDGRGMENSSLIWRSLKPISVFSSKMPV